MLQSIAVFLLKAQVVCYFNLGRPSFLHIPTNESVRHCQVHVLGVGDAQVTQTRLSTNKINTSSNKSNVRSEEMYSLLAEATNKVAAHLKHLSYCQDLKVYKKA